MSKYAHIINWVFSKKRKGQSIRVAFDREDLVAACAALGIPRIRNLGDIPYSFRFRKELPDEIQSAAPTGAEWIIVGAGIARYEFRLAIPGKIAPTSNRNRINIPDATPELVKEYAPGTDEQALLTRIRYNRIIDLFLGITCYSIQNHLRTTVEGIGQIEVDEIYMGVNKRGTHFVIPCQAKSPGDRFGIVQVQQDVELCKSRYPYAICRPIAVQFLGANDLAILELAISESEEIFSLSVVDEKHYQMISRADIDHTELARLSDLEN